MGWAAHWSPRVKNMFYLLIETKWQCNLTTQGKASIIGERIVENGKADNMAT